MVKLTPHVVKSLQFGEVTAYFLEGNEIFFKRQEGVKRNRTSYLRVSLASPNKFVHLEKSEWPQEPEKPQRWVTHEMMYFCTWLVSKCEDQGFQVDRGNNYIYLPQDEISLKEFTTLFNQGRIELSDELQGKADLAYDQFSRMEDELINKRFEPLPTLNEELSKIATSLFTSHDEAKKITQGLKALGLDVEVRRNFLTGGLSGIDDLEQLLLNLSKEPEE
jgi:hypothetical protein